MHFMPSAGIAAASRSASPGNSDKTVTCVSSREDTYEERTWMALPPPQIRTFIVR